MREEVYTKEVCGRWLVDGHLVYQLEEYHDERTGQLRKRNRVWFSVNGQGHTDELAEQIAIDLNSHAALVEALEAFVAHCDERLAAYGHLGLPPNVVKIRAQAVNALAAAKVTP